MQVEDFSITHSTFGLRSSSTVNLAKVPLTLRDSCHVIILKENDPVGVLDDGGGVRGEEILDSFAGLRGRDLLAVAVGIHSKN